MCRKEHKNTKTQNHTITKTQNTRATTALFHRQRFTLDHKCSWYHHIKPVSKPKNDEKEDSNTCIQMPKKDIKSIKEKKRGN